VRENLAYAVLGQLLEIVTARPAPKDHLLWSQFDCQIVDATPGAQTNALFQVVLQLQICFGHLLFAPRIPPCSDDMNQLHMAADDV
jgi:hypothetical protein